MEMETVTYIWQKKQTKNPKITIRMETGKLKQVYNVRTNERNTC